MFFVQKVSQGLQVITKNPPRGRIGFYSDHFAGSAWVGMIRKVVQSKNRCWAARKNKRFPFRCYMIALWCHSETRLFQGIQGLTIVIFLAAGPSHCALSCIVGSQGNPFSHKRTWLVTYCRGNWDLGNTPGPGSEFFGGPRGHGHVPGIAIRSPA